MTLPRPVNELSDEELEAELQKRRRARAAKGGGPTAPTEGGRVARALEAIEKERELARYYANLELKPGASLADVKRKYEELIAKYHPEKHAGDPERFRAATELAAQLTRAYTVLSERLSPKR